MNAATALAARCENCGAPVPHRYCGVCGQRLESPVHSLGHFLEIAFEDLTHADSRLWRSLLALLLQPGHLTREFLGGRRVRYLPPVRLYLVLSVVFFLWAGATQTPTILVVNSKGVADEGAGQAGHASAYVAPLNAPGPGESAQQRSRRVCSYQGLEQGRFTDLMRQACLRATRGNGQAMQQAFLHNLPRAMFLFLPLLAAAMMLLYWHPRRYYVEHLLLLVHNHAFVFLLAPLIWAIAWLLSPLASLLGAAAGLYVAWYAWRSMRVVYGQSPGRTLAKLAAVGFFYFLAGVIMVVATSLYSVLTV